MGIAKQIVCIAALERLTVLGLPYGELHRELSTTIRQIMPVDAFCWHGLDPETQLLTTADPVSFSNAAS